jgi:hypothetical protein
MKKIITISVLLTCSFLTSAQEINPFESIGKEGKILTLSNGKYTEVHINDSLQRIGSVIVNLNTGTIYELLDIDTLYAEATLDPTVISRWYSVDPLFAKYPDKSPYNFVGNNPIMNREIDGRDYEVSIKKSDNGNTITIKAVYYTDIKGSDSYNSAVAATEFWNAQNGKFQYIVDESDGSQTVYDVVFDLSYKESGYGDMSQLPALDDKIGNSYTVRSDENIEGGGLGGTERGKFVDVAESRKETDTGAHEIGHTLNLGHFAQGLMKEIDKAATITRESIVLIEYVKQIIDFSIGKGDMNSDTAPVTKANTTLDNPQNLKTEGSVMFKQE